MSISVSSWRRPERAALALSGITRTGPQRRACQTLAKATAKRRGATRRYEHGERG